MLSRTELARLVMGTMFLVGSERREHTVVLSLTFYYILLYNSVNKILRKIRATTFTENYGEKRARGMSACDERTLLPISLDNTIIYPFATS